MDLLRVLPHPSHALVLRDLDVPRWVKEVASILALLLVILFHKVLSVFSTQNSIAGSLWISDVIHVTLIVFLRALTRLPCYNSIEFFAVEALSFLFASDIGNFLAQEALVRRLVPFVIMWAPDFKIRMRLPWRIGPLALRLMERREIDCDHNIFAILSIIVS